MRTTSSQDDHPISFRSFLYHGVLAGLLSGMVFSIGASFAAIAMGKEWAAPVRLVAAVALGDKVLDPTYPLLSPFMWGMFLHLLYTIVTAILFAWLVAQFPLLYRSVWIIVMVALLYSLLLWLSGFYLIAPLLGWHWFLERTDFSVQFLLQVFVWGGTLAIYFAIPSVRAHLALAKKDRTSP